MKKTIIVFCVALLALAPLGLAVDQDRGITKNGVSQGTLVTILKVHETLLNELAADHDADNATVAELVADHDADNDVMDDLKTLVNELQDAYNESVVQHANLAVSAVAAEKYKTTQSIFAVLKGFSITKTATDNLTFTAADTINVGTAVGDYWGVWKVEMGLDGTLYTNSPSADQTYANEAAAIAALPATTANRVYIGYITVEANSDSAWTANTDDMTAASDCQAANFYDVTEVSQLMAVSSSPAADLTASSSAADLSADSTVGSGTTADPSISLTD